MTRVDPPWWWKPWLHLHPVRDWWYRPRSVSQLATAERDHLNRVVAKRESAAKAVEEALDFAASETYTDLAALRLRGEQTGESISDMLRTGALMVLGICPTCGQKAPVSEGQPAPEEQSP